MTKIPINNFGADALKIRKIATNGYFEGPIYGSLYNMYVDITDILTNRASNKSGQFLSDPIRSTGPVYNLISYRFRPKFRCDSSSYLRRDNGIDPFLLRFRSNHGGGTDHDASLVNDMYDREYDYCRKYASRNGLE